MIALISPTRGRPDKLKRMWQSALTTAHDPSLLSISIGIDQDDASIYDWQFFPGNKSIHTLKDYGIVHGINIMAIDKMMNNNVKLFMIAPDDVIFTTPHWDKALMDHYHALENRAHVYCFRDSRDVDGTPHPILTREYITHMGYFFPPIFLHWYVDTWTSDIAKALGIFTHLKDYELVHDKSADKGNPDDTHKRIRQRGWLERDSFVNAVCQRFLGMEKDRMRALMQQGIG